MKYFILLLFAFSFAAEATCMTTCHDTDGGIDPGYFGVVIQETSCAAPGGPVHKTTSYFLDECHDGIHSEQSCKEEMHETVRVVCKRCSEVREGVCDEF